MSQAGRDASPPGGITAGGLGGPPCSPGEGVPCPEAGPAASDLPLSPGPSSPGISLLKMKVIGPVHSSTSQMLECPFYLVKLSPERALHVPTLTLLGTSLSSRSRQL